MSEVRKIRIILLGAPGAGKGTQAEKLCQLLHIPTISTGSILRTAVAKNTPVGQLAKPYLDAGALVPDEVIIAIIKERLEQSDCADGYILDGVPRTGAQAELLEAAGIYFDHVISMEASDETIMARMSGRRVCSSCGKGYHLTALPPRKPGICDKCKGALTCRSDDKPEVVRNRLAVYHRETAPLKVFYAKRGVLKTVAAHGSVESITQDILRVLEQPTAI